MDKVKFTLDTEGRAQIVLQECFEVTMQQLDVILVGMDRRKNPQKADAKAFMQCYAGKGELATYYELMGDMSGWQVLKNEVAKQVKRLPCMQDQSGYNLRSFKAGRNTTCHHVAMSEPIN